MDADLRNTRARLAKVGVSALLGAIFTFFTMKAISSDGRGPNHDPIGASTVPLLAIFIFVVTTMAAHAIISKRRP